MSLCDLAVELSDRLGLIHQRVICDPLIDSGLAEFRLGLHDGSLIGKCPREDGNLNTREHCSLENLRDLGISFRYEKLLGD